MRDSMSDLPFRHVAMNAGSFCEPNPVPDSRPIIKICCFKKKGLYPDKDETILR